MRLFWIAILISLGGLGLWPATHPAAQRDPLGCQAPPDDYERVEVNGVMLNARTVAMLAHAQTLYDGPIDLTRIAVVQGSYNEGGVALSFGTHDGGGAVDISVRNLPINWTILWDDIPLVIQALRTAGFAAWYRDEEDGMTPHIHAIAIGDTHLSRAASLQLTGRYGYFRGFDGLPQADGVPQADADGPFILCKWMRELGYADLRADTPPSQPPYDFSIGQAVYVNTVWGGTLNLRSEPTVRSAILQEMPSETPLTVMDRPRLAEGYQWWLVRTQDGLLGWSVAASDGGYTLVD
jgi:hypothetical protein